MIVTVDLNVLNVEAILGHAMKQHQYFELGNIRKRERVQVRGKVRLAWHDKALVNVKHGHGFGQLEATSAIKTVAIHG